MAERHSSGTEREIAARLRAAAQEHRPDRERMLDRVTEGIAAPEDTECPARARSVPVWARTAGAAAGLVAALAVGGVVAGWANGTGSEQPQTVRASAERDYLWAVGAVDPGSNPFWTQSNLTVVNDQPLTSLTVEMRIAWTEGVEQTGSWRTRPAQDFDVTVRRERGALVFRWALREGRTVPVGEHVFAGQFNHAAGGRTTGQDSYRITGDGPEGAVAVRGAFP